MRKGRGHGHASLNKAIDDLLGGDDDESALSYQKHGTKNPTTAVRKSGASSSSKKTLSANASSKDFYSSLSAIAGHDVVEDENDEDVDINPEDAKQVAKSLADMDDLESDLFGSFGSKKSSSKSKGSVSLLSKQKKKTQDFSDFDEDDPLAGLGLSDEEDNVKARPKKADLSRKLSQTSSKARVDPNLGASTSFEPDTSPLRSLSFEKDDPFLALDPRPRSGSGSDRMVRRMNSWDDPSVGTQSESEVTPRSRSNSSSLPKNTRKGSKKKVNPVLAESGGKQPDVAQEPPSSPKDPLDSPKDKPDGEVTGVQRKHAKKPAKDADDIFGDDDDLPGLSGDEIEPKKVSAKKVAVEEPTRKATSALDDLLGGRSKKNEQRGRKPTFLDQMMSKPGGNASDLPIETESPITSPREREVKFGGYSPSVGGTRERPTTAPNKRSVRFADELGFDELDFSFSESRPSTAPDSGKPGRGGAKSRDISAGSSFDDENTDVSLDLSFRDSKKATSKRINNKSSKSNGSKAQGIQDTATVGKDNETRQIIDIPKKSAGQTSPRRSLQASRRNKQGFLAGEDEHEAKSKAMQAGPKDPAGKEEEKQAKPTLTKQTSQDDWLGLGDQDINEDVLTKRKQRSNEETATTQEQSSNVVPDDELFPWETSDRSGRQKRAGFNKRQPDQSAANERTLTEVAGARETVANDSLQDPVSHSTPLLKEKVVPRDLPKEDYQNRPRESSQPPPYEQHAGKQTGFPDSSPSVQHARSDIGQNMIPPSQSELGNQRGNQWHQSTIQQINPQTNNDALPYRRMDTSQVIPQNTDLAQMALAHGNSPLSANGMPPAGVHLPFDDRTLLSLQMEKLNAEQSLHQRAIEQYQVANSQMQQDRRSLESQVRDLQSKIGSMEDGRMKRDIELSKKVEDLEGEVRRLKNEKEVLTNSHELAKRRHEEEKKNYESSFKSRLQIAEDTYKNREVQIKEENDFTIKQFNERIKAMEEEKTEIKSASKERIAAIERSKEADVERIKGLHKKAMEELRSDYEEQLERLRQLKEQEIAAATSMFSQTKSLQSLIQQVHNSTTEMEQLQRRIGISHKDNLSEREASLRVRDEYLKTTQERLCRQEAENSDERTRLQSLVSKLELQLRDQGRQFDQDKWKLAQDEIRVASLQASFEDERRQTMQQLASERQMVEKSRDDLIKEQRKVFSQCHEERRKLEAEKAQLEALQGKYNKESLEREYAVLKEREAKIVGEEERLDRERKALEQSFETVNSEKQKLEEFAKEIYNKSKEVELMSKDAVKMKQEGFEALEQSHALRLEVSNASSMLETRTLHLEQQESALKRDQASLRSQQTQIQATMRSFRCVQCQQTVEAAHFIPSLRTPTGIAEASTEYQLTGPRQIEPLLPRPSSPTSSSVLSNDASNAPINESQSESRVHGEAAAPPPPDILLGSLHFSRAVRKWSADKEQDEEFFEEESRFLNEIQKKRSSKFAS